MKGKLNPATITQFVAYNLKGNIKGSIKNLSSLSGLSIDSLRVHRRGLETVGRPLPNYKIRLFALLLAAKKRGILIDLIREARIIEQDWQKLYPGGQKNDMA